MNFKPSLLALGSACFCLLASSTRAQDGHLNFDLPDQRENNTPSYTVTTIVFPTGGGTAAGGGTKAAGKSFTLTASANATLKDVFLYWTTNGVLASAKSSYTFTPTSSETAVANFGYTITTSSSPTAGGKTTGANAYLSGQNVTVTATPGDCYDFTGWTKAGQTAVLSTETSYTFPAVATEALVANFKLKEDQITTASSPAAGGTTTGAKTYGCDTTVTVSAKAANGYKFNSWTSNNVEVSTKNPYSFEASGAEALTAVFEDISVPTLTLASPKASESVSSPFLTVTGTANNVLGVSSVVLTLGGVSVPVTSGNNWSNWTASLVLSPGTNVIDVYALSEVGTHSKTATVTVKYTSTGFAPFALAGLLVQVDQGTNGQFDVSFGAATYEQLSANTNQGSSVGNYTYTQTGPNTATLVLVNLAPPNQVGQGNSGINLTFTSPDTANFVDGSGNTGAVTLSPGPTPEVSSLSGWTIVEAPGSPVTGSLQFAGSGGNAFDPAGGGVPPGYANSTSPTVTLGSGDNVFGYGTPSGYNVDTADFNGNTLTVTDAMNENGADAWQMTFTDPAFTGITKVSDDFINGGLATLISGDVITLSWAGSYGPDVYVLHGTYTAVFDLNITPTAPDATNTFHDGTFASTDSNGTNTAGQYTSMQYGPMATMVVTVSPDFYVGGTETNYTMFIFTATNAGNFSTTHYDGAGDPPSYISGAFTGTYQPSGVKYIAPESLNGYSFTVTQKSPQAEPGFNVTFGQATLAQNSTSTDNPFKVANYTYTRTSATTGILNIYDYLPPSNGGGDNGSPILLTFSSPTSCTYDNPSGPSSGTITSTVLPQADYFAPAALPAGVINYSSSGKSGSAQVADGMFTSSDDTGTYTYAQFSPTVGMLVTTDTDPANAGEVDYHLLTFTSATGGTLTETENGGSIKTGTFSLAK